MLTLESPELVRVTVCVCCVPTVKLPNASLLALRVSCPAGAALPVPLPARLKVFVPFDASLVIVVVALKDATALGANEILIGVLCPAATVSGRLLEAKEKYLLEMAMREMVTVAAPEFVTVAERVLLLPAATPPKSRVEVDSDSVPDCGWLSDLPTLKPWQPVSRIRVAQSSTTYTAFEGCLEETALANFRILVDLQPRGSATVCARGMAAMQARLADETVVDARGTPRQWSADQ